MLEAVEKCLTKAEEIKIDEDNLRRELVSILNKHSRENYSDTPDYVLADYLIGCLKAFENGVNQRNEFYKGANND